jgi:hypothetical protein
MSSNNIRRTLLAASASLALSFAVSAAAEPLSVPPKVSFDKDVHVPDAVRKECGLETKIPEYVKASAAGDGKGGKLDMKITGLLATGGGTFTGPKSVTVSGTLRQGGKVTGTFVARRNASAGAFGGGGTCNMLDRCAKAIGKDIATWLKSPSMDARLGDAR